MAYWYCSKSPNSNWRLSKRGIYFINHFNYSSYSWTSSLFCSKSLLYYERKPRSNWFSLTWCLAYRWIRRNACEWSSKGVRWWSNPYWWWINYNFIRINYRRCIKTWWTNWINNYVESDRFGKTFNSYWQS